MIGFGFGWNDEVVRRPDGTLIRRIALVEGIGTTDGAVRTLEGSYALSESPVLEELGPTDQAIGGGLDALGEARTRKPFPGDDIMKPSIRAAPNLFGQNGDGAIKPRAKIHASSIYPKRGDATQKNDLPQNGSIPHLFDMDAPWPFLDNFNRAVAVYRKRTGHKNEEIAHDLGISKPYLQNIMYGQKNPSLSMLQSASKLFDVSILNFVDDPGGKPEGIPSGDWADLSEAKRAVLFMMHQNLKDPSVSDEQALQYWRIVQAAVEAGKIRSPRFS